jgi:hypothetical protein
MKPKQARVLALQHTRACLFCVVALALAWSMPACGLTDRTVSEGAPSNEGPPSTTSGGDAASGGSAPTAGVAPSEAGPPGDTGTLGEAGSPASMLPPGLSDMPLSTLCGAESCQSRKVGPIFIDPCCDSSDRCGLTTSFLAGLGAHFEEVCQAHHQAGQPSNVCPAATGLALPVATGAQTLMVPLDSFAGCCRPDGSCGVVVDKLSTNRLPLASLDLGCVDAAPFMKGKVNSCSGGSVGTGAGGAGGEAAGGAPNGIGGAG